jgi:glycosyltransferase involved in cell wall biosynthesis
VLVTGPGERRVRIGSFEVRMLREGGGMKAAEFMRMRHAALDLVRERRDRLQFDAVVTYDPLKTGIAGLHVARAAHAALIVEVNGDYTARSNYADIQNPVRRRLRRRMFMGVERFVLKRADGIKTLYPDQLRRFQSALHGPVVRMFPNFVDVSDFRDLGETREVLFAGFPYYLKGLDVLVAAFKAVSEEFPDWRLKILGWFPDQTALREAIGGHPRIVVHPPVYRRDMPEHMGRCGIFVLPSRTEAMGRVLIEAMACAKPRIGTTVGGIPGVIAHGHDGLLVAPGSIADLVSALRSLMSDPHMRHRLGQNGLRRVHSDFSATAYFARLREFYHAVLEGRGGTG